MGVETLTQLIAQHLEEHGDAHAFHASCRTARATADQHTQGQDNPRDVGPLASIVVEQSRRRHKRHHGEQRRPEGMLQTIVVAHDELHHDEGGEQRSEHKVEPELSVAPQRLDLLLDHGTIEQREVDTRDEAEESGRILHPRRMEMLDTVVVDRVATRGCRRHSVVDALEPVHAKEHEAGHAAKGNEQIDEPNPFGTRRKPWAELALDRSGSLSGKHFRAATDHLRQYGNGEEHDSQTAYPVGQRPPEQDAMG